MVAKFDLTIGCCFRDLYLHRYRNFHLESDFVTVSPKEADLLKLSHYRARDQFKEFAALAVALEGVIDSTSSAIKGMFEKSVDIVFLNNKLQDEAKKNSSV